MSQSNPPNHRDKAEDHTITAFHGDIIHTPTPERFEVIEDLTQSAS